MGSESPLHSPFYGRSSRRPHVTEEISRTKNNSRSVDQKYQTPKINQNGYCYELNGCLFLLLHHLGFRVSIISTRVAGKQGTFSPEYDHLVLLVNLEKRWLADVGFVDSFTRPLDIDKTLPRRDRQHHYTVTGDRNSRLVSRRMLNHRSWQPVYSFSLRPRNLADFRSRNIFQQESPQSHFVQGPVISQLTKTGRVTLTAEKLVLTRGNKRTERQVRNPAEFGVELERHFQLKI